MFNRISLLDMNKLNNNNNNNNNSNNNSMNPYLNKSSINSKRPITKRYK